MNNYKENLEEFLFDNERFGRMIYDSRKNADFFMNYISWNVIMGLQKLNFLKTEFEASEVGEDDDGHYTYNGVNLIKLIREGKTYDELIEKAKKEQEKKDREDLKKMLKKFEGLAFNEDCDRLELATCFKEVVERKDYDWMFKTICNRKIPNRNWLVLIMACSEFNLDDEHKKRIREVFNASKREVDTYQLALLTDLLTKRKILVSA